MLYDRRQQNAPSDRTIQRQGTQGKSLPAMPFLQKPAIPQPVVQGYFTYYGHALSADNILHIEKFLNKFYNPFVANAFSNGAQRKDNQGTISDWLKTNKVNETVKDILATNVAPDKKNDDNISLFSDFEDTNLERWEELKGQQYHPSHENQFTVFSHIRDTLKEKSEGEGLKTEGLNDLFKSMSNFNGYNQATFGFARKEGERNDDDDRLFGTKISTVPMRYLGKTLTDKNEYDWHNTKKSKTNEYDFERGLAETMIDKDLQPEEYEIMISRARCQHCKDDPNVNRFGHIHAEGEDEL